MNDSSRHLDIIFAPGSVAHPGTATELASRAADKRGLTARMTFAADTTEFYAAASAAADRGEFIVSPGAGNTFSAPECGVIRLDFGDCPEDRSDHTRMHIRGRGLEGLRYAVDGWYHHRFHPGTIVRYGSHRDQRCELRIPNGKSLFPVAVLIHGGYWRAPWELDLMDALAVDLTNRGYLTWNVEYRRSKENGWAAMTSDVADALQAVSTIPEADLERVVVLGHSAGGQLALRAAADAVADTETATATVRPALAVSLAGVLDLRLADERGLGGGAVSNAVGGRWPDDRATYEQSSPIDRLPLQIPQLVACGTQDEPDLLEISREFVAAAAETTDNVQLIEGPGNHFSVIDPESEIWGNIADAIDAIFGRVSDSQKTPESVSNGSHSASSSAQTLRSET
ncbi:alpha/beta hydrolase family protein [Rhodococcus sp. WMMA185]|uniref:alpha/beta hydrolase family protein n=1 Tax=Rhodococcus sp. WMMA185 TaxID=679318 RepID=UPI000A020534|nr:alpha/beta hydrolase [Rhodococcus sp. WMMA185]